MNATTTACTCGNTKPHVIARRSTSDGKHVCLWDDGQLTWALGYSIKGGMNPKTDEQRDRARTVGRLVLGEVELFTAAEVSELIAAARWAAARDGLPGTVRKRLADQRRKAALPKPMWRTMSTDRNGKPTERVWVLPRLSPWRDHAVWDERNSRGRYHLHILCTRSVVGVRVSADPAYEPTGASFDTLDALLTWMAENPPTRVDHGA
jgi:hypothetical protein